MKEMIDLVIQGIINVKQLSFEVALSVARNILMTLFHLKLKILPETFPMFNMNVVQCSNNIM